VLSADVLVLAAGSVPNYFGVPGAAEHSFPMYSVADAERLRVQVQSQLTQANEAGGDGELSFVVVGGGPTGVETSGALAEILLSLGAEGRLKRPARVHLVDRGKVLLASFSEKAHHYVLRKLTEHGVDVRLRTGVAEVATDAISFEDGSHIDTQTVVWAGGSSGTPLVGEPAPGHGGRLDVARDLSVPGLSGVYAIGDAANIADRHGQALPQLGSVAQQSGELAAANIVAALAGREQSDFKYKDKGIMAMIGRNAAVAEVGKHRHEVDGPLAFAAWLGVHAMLLSGTHSKTDAFVSWAWDYFDRDHAAVVESASTPSRIAWGDADADVPHIRV
jgi:NADH:ubiquinone reductase (H+-translocating)